MPTNKYGQTYSGNDDFRGWLAGGGAAQYYSSLPIGQLQYGGRPEDAATMTKTLLGQVGNTGRSGNTLYDKAGQYLYGQYQAGQKMAPTEDPAVTAANIAYKNTLAQIAAQPKLIYRDTNAAWKNAQNTAATSVNPVYADKMNLFIQKQANKLAQTQATAEASKKASDVSLGQTQEDILTNKENTQIDTNAVINESKVNEGSWAKTEGTTNTAAEEAARLALGDQGVMGRGAGQLQEAKLTRNVTSAEQTKAFEKERANKELLKTRTFTDLETKGTRAVKFNETEKADLDRQVNDFITNQGTEKTEYQAINEEARLSKLAEATGQQYKTDTASWLASLQGNQRAQDILLATQIYGS